MDSLQNKRILTPSGMRTAQRLAENRRYRTTSRPWRGQHDGRSQSPVETAARLRLMDAGIVLLRFFARQVHEGTMVGTVRSVLDREGWVPARPIPPPVRRR